MELARRVKAGLRSLADESGEFTREAMIALQNRSIALEKTLEFVASDETNRWLYVNRQERMDATATIFERSRRDFHIERYRVASERVSGRRTLDCASGTGYGVRILVEIGRAASSIGVEIDNEAVEYASKRHHIQGATFICASGDRMPLPNGCVDVITSFETVEHVPDDEALILEFRRVLRSEGLLFISTPNQWPVEVSPFHLREYDKDSFLSVLSRGFECVELYNQNSGSQTPYNHNQAAGIVATTPENEHLAECYLAVCRRRA